MFKLRPMPRVVGMPGDSKPTMLSEAKPNDSGSMLSTHFFMISTLLATKSTLTPLIGHFAGMNLVKS